MHTRKELLEFATAAGGLGMQFGEVGRLLRLSRKYGRIQAAQKMRKLSPKEIAQVFGIIAQIRELVARPNGPEVTFSDRITIAGIPVPA